MRDFYESENTNVAVPELIDTCAEIQSACVGVGLTSEHVTLTVQPVVELH